MYKGSTIGVVLATYNGEKYVAEQIRSILNQQLPVDLLIITDASSTDHTIEICKEIISNVKEIEIVILESNRRLNVIENFEKGLEICETDYIFLSDQDDIWKENKIKTMVSIMEETNAVLAFSNATIVDSRLNKKGNLWEIIGFYNKKYITIYEKGSKDLNWELIRHNVVTGMCMCIKSGIKKFILPLSRFGIHDSWISLVALQIGGICAINQPLVLYRQHQNNQIGTSSNIYKKIKRKATYLFRISDRRNMFLDFTERVEDQLDLKVMEIFKDYILFLTEREEFICQKRSLFWAIKNKDKYKKFLYAYHSILLKDYITRMTYRSN